MREGARLREAMVAFIRERLVKTAQWGSGEPFRALSETPVRFNDSTWFWTDDNAKAAELLADPAFYDQAPSAANDAIDFVLRMSEGAIIARRGGPAELRVLSNDHASFRIETAFVIVEGDLTSGIVRHALRFNDRRTLTAAQHTGNLVSFRHQGRPCTLDVENTITAHAIEIGEGSVALSHASTLRRPGGPALATLTYTYTVQIDRPSIGLAVTLHPAPGVILEDVVITTALDQLAAVKGMYYRAIAVRAAGKDRVAARLPDRGATVHAGPAEYIGVLQQGGSPGFAYGIHALLHNGDRLAAVLARGQRRGRLHWLLNRYAIGTVATPQTIREERMVTGGGYYDVPAHYAAVMHEGAGGGEIDPSMSYDIGAELNAIAVHILLARTGQYATPADPDRLARLTTWYDRHLDRFFAFIRPGSPDELDRVFTRGIAFVVLSLDCMLRATAFPRYRMLLATGIRLILALEQRAGAAAVGFADTWSQGHPFLDNHAACILALARSARHNDPAGIPQGEIGRAVHRGIAAIRIHATMVDLGGGHAEPYAGLAVVNPPGAFPHADTGFWNFKLGLVLRALHAARTAAEAGAITMTPLEREEIALRVLIARAMLERSLHKDGDTLELRTSRIAGETNSETQPWAALGLDPALDDRIVTLGTL